MKSSSMKSGIQVMFGLCWMVALTGASGPPGFRPATAGARHEVAGYSVAVPGKGWLESRTENAIVFGKRINATESYHAGMTVQTVARLADKDAFARFAEQKANADSGNPRYKVVRKEQAASEAGGLWKARTRVDFEDAGAVNVGKREMLATEGAHFFVMSPQEPERLITVWFSRRSAKFDEGKFAQESEQFFAGFR